VLVNEINALGVKDIMDLNINRKILQSLRKPDYDLVKAIIYEKKLEDLKPSHILSKIMAHELQLMPKSKKAPQEKPQEPSSPTTSHALSSRQEKMTVQKKLLMNATVVSLRNSIALSNLQMKMPNLCTYA
jgi:hypothetical protein